MEFKIGKIYITTKGDRLVICKINSIAGVTPVYNVRAINLVHKNIESFMSDSILADFLKDIDKLNKEEKRKVIKLLYEI